MPQKSRLQSLDKHAVPCPWRCANYQPARRSYFYWSSICWSLYYIYIYVFIWCWQLENAYGAAEIVSNSWTIFFWSTVHICIMCPIVSLFCCIGAKSAGEPWFFWGNPWFPRVSPKTTILFINHQPIGSTPISHIKCIYRIVGCRIVNPP